MLVLDPSLPLSRATVLRVKGCWPLIAFCLDCFFRFLVSINFGVVMIHLKRKTLKKKLLQWISGEPCSLLFKHGWHSARHWHHDGYSATRAQKIARILYELKVVQISTVSNTTLLSSLLNISVTTSRTDSFWTSRTNVKVRSIPRHYNIASSDLLIIGTIQIFDLFHHWTSADFTLPLNPHQNVKSFNDRFHITRSFNTLL